MPRGKRTPEPIRRFIIKTGQNTLELSYERITEKVGAQFGFEIDKSTVGKILNRAGLHRSRPEVIGDPQVTVDRTSHIQVRNIDLQNHRAKLMPAILDLSGVEPFPERHYDLALWHICNYEKQWPIAKGYMYRNSKSEIEIVLTAESHRAWSPWLSIWKETLSGIALLSGREGWHKTSLPE